MKNNKKPSIQKSTLHCVAWILTIFFINSFASDVLGQDTEVTSDSSALPIQRSQITFFHPIGTNGLEAERTINRFSFNIIAGVQGGLEGLEVAGFVSVDRGDVKGAQFAGFANLVGGNVSAVQYAGFMNTSGGYLRGGQVSGFLNFATDSVIGGQIAGFMNASKGAIRGAQVSGFINKARDVQGAQVAAFYNNAHTIQGAQVGFINHAQTLNGNQLGFINVVDSLGKGTPIGFLSFVKKGGHKSFQVSTSDALYLTAGFRMGSQQFYNILSFGARNDNEAFTWALGYGIGTQFYAKPKSSFGMEVISYHLNEDELWTNRVNMLNRLSFPVTFTLFKGTEMVIAPNINVTVKRRNRSEGVGFDPNIAPYTFFDDVNGNYRVQMWGGLEAGIRF